MLEKDVLNLTLEMLHSHKDHAQILSRCLQLLWSFLRDAEVRDEICTQEMLDLVLEEGAEQWLVNLCWLRISWGIVLPNINWGFEHSNR